MPTLLSGAGAEGSATSAVQEALAADRDERLIAELDGQLAAAAEAKQAAYADLQAAERDAAAAETRLAACEGRTAATNHAGPLTDPGADSGEPKRATGEGAAEGTGVYGSSSGSSQHRTRRKLQDAYSAFEQRRLQDGVSHLQACCRQIAFHRAG